MVGLMQERAGQQFLAGFFVPFSIHVLGADGDLVGAGHVFAKIGDAEAALTLRLFTFSVNDLGIGEHQLLARIFFEADVDDSQPF
jgi:hypothetical protein